MLGLSVNISFSCRDVQKSDFQVIYKNSYNLFHSKRVNLFLAWPTFKVFTLQIDALELKFPWVRSVVVPLKQCDLV